MRGSEDGIIEHVDKKFISLKKELVDKLRENNIIDHEYTGQITLHVHIGICRDLIKTEKI